MKHGVRDGAESLLFRAYGREFNAQSQALPDECPLLGGPMRLRSPADALKRLRPSDNQVWMGMKCRRRWFSLIVLLSAIALLSVLIVGDLGRVAIAQIFPFERNKVEQIDPRQAFVDGYTAYQRRDWLAAIERMQLAATQVPELVDYALFFQGRAQQENGDLAGGAATLQRLTA